MKLSATLDNRMNSQSEFLNVHPKIIIRSVFHLNA